MRNKATRQAESIEEKLKKLQTILCQQLTTDCKLREQAQARISKNEHLLRVIELRLSHGDV